MLHSVAGGEDPQSISFQMGLQSCSVLFYYPVSTLWHILQPNLFFPQGQRAPPSDSEEDLVYVTAKAKTMVFNSKEHFLAKRVDPKSSHHKEDFWLTKPIVVIISQYM